jgi:hypothetical protein
VEWAQIHLGGFGKIAIVLRQVLSSIETEQHLEDLMEGLSALIHLVSALDRKIVRILEHFLSRLGRHPWIAWTATELTLLCSSLGLAVTLSAIYPLHRLGIDAVMIGAYVGIALLVTCTTYGLLWMDIKADRHGLRRVGKRNLLRGYRPIAMAGTIANVAGMVFTDPAPDSEFAYGALVLASLYLIACTPSTRDWGMYGPKSS